MAGAAPPKFQISLAQYSLHRRLWHLDGATPLDPLEFPAVARSLGIDAVEYVSMLWRETLAAKGDAWLQELKIRAESEGVKNLLIMVDREGMLGDKDPKLQGEAVVNHARWLEVAAELGCHSIRVDPKTNGETREEGVQLLAEGVHQLCERAQVLGLNVLIENEAGWGADADWLVEVMDAVSHSRAGLLPDFGNFWIDEEKGELYDPVKGVRKMMPYSKAVSAKSYGFEPGSQVSQDTREGRELALDFAGLMGVVTSSGYSGHIGIEYEGPGPEMEGIQQTLEVLKSLQ